MRKIVFQNLSIAFFSKAIGFLSFVYIARTLSENEYGVYIYLIMVLSLLPLLQLGSMHGTSILLPKYIANPNKNEVELFVYSNVVSHLIQFAAVLFLFLFDIDLDILTLVVIGANFFLSLYTQNAQIYLNSIHEFQKTNIIKAFEQILKPCLVLSFFYFFRSLESIFTAQLIATTIILLISFLIVPIKSLRIDSKRFKEKTLKIYKIGFFVYIVWAIDIIFRTSDRWFVSEFYSVEELAAYGFSSSLALNVWLISMIFCEPYGQILYTQVAEEKYKDIKRNIQRTNIKLYLLVFFVSVIAIVAYPYVLELVIKKYYETELLFFTLVISSLFLSINHMYIYYMISNNFHFILLKYQAIILAINVLLNCFFVFYHMDILYYSYSTVFASAIYFILVRRFFYFDIDKKIKLNNI